MAKAYRHGRMILPSPYFNTKTLSDIFTASIVTRIVEDVLSRSKYIILLSVTLGFVYELKSGLAYEQNIRL
jgi:hypothetical protein